MNQRIIYSNEDGSVAIITPANCGLTIQQIALKDVPFGKPFKIVDASEISSNRTQRNAWAVDVADLTDGVGADYGVGSNKPFVMPETAQ